MNKLTGLKKLPLALVVGALMLTGCSEPQVVEKNPIKLVKTFNVNDFDSLNDRQFSGRIKGANEINLMFRVGGPLVEYPTKVGDRVEKGDLVAQIDRQDFLTQVAQLEGELAAAEANRNLAIREYQRAKTVYERDSNLISESVLDQRLAAVDSSKGQVISLKAALQSSRDALSYTTLTAPFSGRITSTYVDNFEYVMPQQPIVKIVSLDNMEVVVDVPESLVSMTDAVKNIKVTFPRLPGVETTGYITEIGTESSDRTRTYPVTVGINMPEDVELFAGMSVTVSGEVDQSSLKNLDSFELPAAAVFSRNNKEYVWRVTSNSELEKVEVKSKQMTPRGVRITGDITTGDTVVAAGTKFLKEGDVVEVLPDNKLMR